LFVNDRIINHKKKTMSKCHILGCDGVVASKRKGCTEKHNHSILLMLTPFHWRCCGECGCQFVGCVQCRCPNMASHNSLCPDQGTKHGTGFIVNTREIDGEAFHSLEMCEVGGKHHHHNLDPVINLIGRDRLIDLMNL
jgi:hypothetical protein